MVGSDSALRRGTKDRHAHLVRLIRRGTTRVEDLARDVGVSESTVRRDLTRLESDGELSRTYGGAMPRTPFRELALSERLAEATGPKAAIGAAAAERVPDGATIFVDAGSTCAQLVASLRERNRLTVITRGLEIAVMLADSDHEVIVVGGRVSPKSHGLAGAITMFVMERLSVDLAFLGCDAVDAELGVGEPTLEEAATKEMIARQAQEVLVLAHAQKLGRHQVPAWARLPRGWELITDEGRSDALAGFREQEVRVTSVEG
ncbi:DeoR/GlpR family DNA-binding transcription regulator [Ornithinimicrobium sp. Y1694]|uniref:DeoR/GlpR family DNA-binding transcription regulator n=1 Tax=Ornithinimicrobium sp. Y1694 TaxID=3418590 RepID=UPI003CF0CF57